MNESLWTVLLGVRRWCRQCDLPFQAQELSADVWRVGPNSFLTTGPWTEGWQPSTDGPRVLGIQWACSDQVVESFNNGGPVPESLVVPAIPPAILVLGGVPTFASIRKAMISEGDGIEIESATSEGQFNYRELRIGRFGYCFRSEIEYPAELPFVINVTPA